AARPPSSSTTAPPPNPTLFPYTTLFRSEISAHNASVRLMDFEKGIQLPEKVDTIIMSLVLHHIPNYQALLASLLEQLNEEVQARSEEHTSELQSRFDLVCRLLLEKKKRI